MLSYVLIGLSLSLAGVAGLQFFYMIYLERLGHDYRKRIRELELHAKHLSKRLEESENQVAEQSARLNAFYLDAEKSEENDDGEIWADVIDDR